MACFEPLREQGDETAALRTRIADLEMLQRELLATIGHELRTPITVIQGCSENMLDAPERSPEMDAEFLGAILKASRHLSGLVDRCLMLTRVFAGELALDPQPLELWEAVDRALNLHSERITDCELIIERFFPPGLPLVKLDGECLEAVLQALIENAIKFNRRAGSIEIIARPSLVASRAGVALEITNTGEGIPADRLDSIFGLFDQVDTGSTRRFGGLGLGLPLVRHLLDHGGARIEAASPGLGQGATFTLWLPGA